MNGADEFIWCLGPLRIDREMRRVWVAAKRVELAPREYELLVALARRAGRTCSRRELLREAWGGRLAGHTRTVDSHASRLRRKLDAAGGEGLVTSIWGVGYRLL